MLTVVKCGGAAAVDLDLLCADVASLVRSGERIVLAHGASAEIERLAGELGITPRELRAADHTTARYSDPATVDVVTLALAGRVKPRLLARLSACTVTAVGLTGLDGGLIQAERKLPPRALVRGRDTVIHDDHSGRITGVNTTIVRVLLDAGMTPVVSPPVADRHGMLLNVDADRVAGAIAAGLAADRLVFLTDQCGVLRDVTDAGSVLDRCGLSATGQIRLAGGGMRRKLAAARAALLGGVSQVVISDGRIAGPVAAALSGAGTTVEIAEPDRAGVT